MLYELNVHAQVVLSFEIAHVICSDRLVATVLAIALVWFTECAFDLQLFPLYLNPDNL